MSTLQRKALGYQLLFICCSNLINRISFLSHNNPGFDKKMCSDCWNDYTLYRGKMHW